MTKKRDRIEFRQPWIISAKFAKILFEIQLPFESIGESLLMAIHEKIYVAIIIT